MLLSHPYLTAINNKHQTGGTGTITYIIPKSKANVLYSIQVTISSKGGLSFIIANMASAMKEPHIAGTIVRHVIRPITLHSQSYATPSRSQQPNNTSNSSVYQFKHDKYVHASQCECSQQHLQLR